MKSIKPSVACLLLAALLGPFGCATNKTCQTESLLSAAGFRTLTPTTQQQQACYTALPPDQLQRRDINGKVVYAFADKQQDLVYVGGEQQYQRFKELGLQKQIADERLQAAQMNDDAALNWGYWGPAGWWWY